MKHSYTVLLVIMLAVIAISVFFPRSQFVEGFDMDDVDSEFDKVKGKINGNSGNDDDSGSDEDDSEHEDDGTKKIDEPQAADHTQHCATYTSEDGNTARICTSFKNKHKDNMDLVQAGNSDDTTKGTETFANWNPSW